jgi:hypothetical protein
MADISLNTLNKNGNINKVYNRDKIIYTKDEYYSNYKILTLFDQDFDENKLGITNTDDTITFIFYNTSAVSYQCKIRIIDQAERIEDYLLEILPAAYTFGTLDNSFYPNTLYDKI